MAKILLIDDDARTLALLDALLQGNGHQVVTVSSGQEGVDLVTEDQSFDLIVTDLNMNTVSGWEVVRRIRAVPGCATVPIMALSAFTSAQDRDEAFEAGCSAYENKPINQDRLLDKITKLLKA